MQKLNHKFGDDGAFWIEYSDLLNKYQTFDRTRLFGDSWSVTQAWCSLTIPWSVEYNKTKFCFILENKTSVVVVLSQLDDRYFCGLEGQYEFELSFRIHKAGEEDYIVRSHSGYSMRRSTNAELELEAGEYHVLMKVEATRNLDKASVEDVVRCNVKERRHKLLRIGLAYDLAHAKGVIKETDEEKNRRKRIQEVEKAKEHERMRQKLTIEKKKRTHNQNKEKRKQRAAATKRKEKTKAKAEKVAAKEKMKEDGTKYESKAAKISNDKEEQKSNEKADVKQDASEKGSENTTPDENAKEAEAAEVALDDSEKGPLPEQIETANPAPPEVSNPAETSTEATSADEMVKIELPGTLETPVLGGSLVPPSMISTDLDSDDESDIVSVVSDISDGAVEDAIAEAKLAAEAAIIPLPPPNQDDENEFEKDPWNAVAVVGLRVYSKDSAVSVKVIRPVDGDHEEEKGEAKLDVDDSAADATKGITLEEENPAENGKVGKGPVVVSD